MQCRKDALHRDIHEGYRTPSWLSYLIYSLSYTIGTIWLAAHGVRPFTPPWITLNQDLYYLVETFYAAPLVFLMWILAAGLSRTLGRLFGGNGSFENAFRMMGYSLWAPWYPLIVVDFLPGVPGWLYNAVLAVCLTFLVFQNTVVVRAEEGLGWVKSTVVSVLSIGAIGIILFTYIR